jgi:ParB family chromosome partitioning protein
MTTAITTAIPLAQLRVDEKANVRKIGRGADPAFVGSVAQHGIMVPLMVRPNGSGYVVIDGGKRLEAAKALLQEGKLPADYAAPCVVRKGNDAEARETSLTLNVIRSDMHPVDEFRGFAALHSNKEQPLDVEQIAARFGLQRKHVEQRLALGALDDSVLDAWRDGKIGADAAKAFTLCADKAQQAKILKKVTKDGQRVSDWTVKQELKLGGHNNPGHLLNVVGREAYEKRGGRVTMDLFGTDHRVSNPALLVKMVQEAIEAKCKELTGAGWAWAAPSEGINDRWSYGTLERKHRATKDEQTRLDQLAELVENGTEEQSATAEAEYDKLEAEIANRGFTAEQRATAGCFVGVGRNGEIAVEYGKIKPAERKKMEAQERAQTSKKAGSKPAEKKVGGPDISNALAQRLSEQLTAAASVAIAKEPTVAMAALLAGFAGSDKTVSVEERGLARKRATTFRKPTAFEGVFTAMLGKTPAELQVALAEVAAAALDFQTHNATRPALQDKGVAALCNALKATALNKAIRETFDAKDYFDAVSKGLVVVAVRETMGDDHAAKVAKMPKGEAAKFAVANVPKTGWLPPQMRTAHYDGPAAKKTTAKKPAKARAKTKTAAVKAKATVKKSNRKH